MGSLQGSQPTWFERMTAEVKYNSEKIENNILQPLTLKSRELLAERPVLFVFLLSTSILSVIPLSCFILFATFVIGGSLCLITLLAITAVCALAFLFVILTGPLFGLVAITILACASSLTFLLVTGYFMQRLRVHAHITGSIQQAFPIWLEETRETLFNEAQDRHELQKQTRLTEEMEGQDRKPEIFAEINHPHSKSANSN